MLALLGPVIASSSKKRAGSTPPGLLTPSWLGRRQEDWKDVIVVPKLLLGYRVRGRKSRSKAKRLNLFSNSMSKLGQRKSLAPRGKESN